MNVEFNPQSIIVSALAPTLEAKVGTLIDRKVIQGLEYESGTWSPESDTINGKISFAKQHSNRPFFAAVCSNHRVEYFDFYTALGCYVISYYDWTGHAIPNAGSGQSNSLTYGYAQMQYCNTISYAVTSMGYMLTADPNVPMITDRLHDIRAFVTPEKILLPNGANQYQQQGQIEWRSNIVYDWLAVWMPE